MLNGESVERHGTVQADGENGCFGKSGRIWVRFTMPASGQWTRWLSTTPLQPLPSAVFLDAFGKDGKDGTQHEAGD